MDFEIKVLKELGHIARRQDRVVVQIVSYGGKDGVVNVQKEFEDKDSGEWRLGKRPAYDEDTLRELLPILEMGLKELATGKYKAGVARKVLSTSINGKEKKSKSKK